MKSGERTIRMSIVDEDSEFMAGHVVDGKNKCITLKLEVEMPSWEPYFGFIYERLIFLANCNSQFQNDLLLSSKY